MPARACECARQKADGQNQFADVEADDPGGANIASGDPRGKAEHRVIDQNVGSYRGDEAEHQAPVHVGAWDASDHVDRADFARRRLVEAGGGRASRPSTR